ncbi:Rad2 nuclease [Cichlidogyrus casuarinus]|uniref:Exonuclease 1 n=1 Tax=Cichlidogyrus casuarinus TaxID=1844966 RepID=A0ABD2QDM4_9PLAT
MGIKGLLPFLKRCTVPINLKHLSGYVLAVDSYCWIHKGAFSCAAELGMGKNTDKYLNYVLTFVKMMLSFNIKPILVFDGNNLVAKRFTDGQRREKKLDLKKKAAEYLASGDRKNAQICFERSVEVTSEMAFNVLKAVRELGVDCIVAPYEADAQLYYLCASGFADVIVTEDSDLLAFGAKQVIFKLDQNGNGTLVTWSSGIGENCCGMTPGRMTEDLFRYICILAGCDYFPGVPGIGMANACKIMRQCRETDFRQLLENFGKYTNITAAALKEIPLLATATNEQSSSKNSGKKSLPQSTINAAIRAERTFRLQVVFDPVKRCRLRISEPRPCDISDPLDQGNFDYAGTVSPYESPSQDLEIALGNIDFHSGRRFSDFKPNESYFKSIKNAYKSGMNATLTHSASSPTISNQFSSKFGLTKTTDVVTVNRPSIRRLHHSIWSQFYPVQKIWLHYKKPESNALALTNASVLPYSVVVSPKENREIVASSTPLRGKRPTEELESPTFSPKRIKNALDSSFSKLIPDRKSITKLKRPLFMPSTPGGSEVNPAFVTPEKHCSDVEQDVETCERLTVKFKAVRKEEMEREALEIAETELIGKELANALNSQSPSPELPASKNNSFVRLTNDKNKLKPNRVNVFAQKMKENVDSDWSSLSNEELVKDELLSNQESPTDIISPVFEAKPMPRPVSLAEKFSFKPFKRAISPPRGKIIVEETPFEQLIQENSLSPVYPQTRSSNSSSKDLFLQTQSNILRSPGESSLRSYRKSDSNLPRTPNSTPRSPIFQLPSDSQCSPSVFSLQNMPRMQEPVEQCTSSRINLQCSPDLMPAIKLEKSPLRELQPSHFDNLINIEDSPPRKPLYKINQSIGRRGRGAARSKVNSLLV